MGEVSVKELPGLTTKHAIARNVQVICLISLKKYKLHYPFSLKDKFLFLVTGEEATRPMLNVDSEIISLFARPSCPKPPSFPIENTLALYSTLSSNDVILCGFSSEEKGCFRYQILENNWAMEELSLLENRSHASSISYNNNSWIITGGQKYTEGAPVLLDSSEILKNYEFTQGPTLPIPLSGHCSIKWNEGHIFIAGGYGDQSHLINSFILNIEELSWEYLPMMKYGRFGHACGKVMTLFNEIEFFIAGGLHQNKIEKYSIVHSKWFTLPNIENQPIFRSATVQGETTFVISGGFELEPDCTTKDCRQDSIKIFDKYGKTLKIRKERLSQGRGNHVSTQMPSKAICSGKNTNILN